MKALTIGQVVQVAMLALVAGYVDAIGFLATKGFFVSFMSGNSTRLGAGLQDQARVALTALGLIASFFFGAVVATVLQVKRPHTRDVLLLVAALVAGAACLLPMGVQPDLGFALLAAGMGAVNLVHARDGDVRFGVTYVTGALVKAAQALGRRLSGIHENRALPYFTLWLSLVSGAAIGALAFGLFGTFALWASVAAILGLAIIARPARMA